MTACDVWSYIELIILDTIVIELPRESLILQPVEIGIWKQSDTKNPSPRPPMGSLAFMIGKCGSDAFHKSNHIPSCTLTWAPVLSRDASLQRTDMDSSAHCQLRFASLNSHNVWPEFAGRNNRSISLCTQDLASKREEPLHNCPVKDFIELPSSMQWNEKVEFNKLTCKRQHQR